MIKDTNGIIYINVEFLEKRMEEIQVNVNDTKSLTKKLDALEAAFENIKARKQGHARLEAYFKEIKQYLPEEKHSLIMKLDDLFSEVLILYEEYFYKHGYYDGRNYKGLIARAKNDFQKCRQEGEYL